ncbi:glycosyltransferase family 2 protein [Agromyces archimandritae]|uniref:4,4'-diaponeurosporenoate glycosyltransferase n=1 Tax=Agromyces archimandritae TaxID=2781962 RepID=A0A975INY2_9MICO|nr:glycosyltransferase family 2 protein [Agromyces archimandritae]QTX05062.1 glycosyltransferase family 2 protein [Agromyces archimandritae]
MTTISVVVPSLNDARFLENCLAALARQTRPADEIVVVDNGSSDDTAEVGRAFGARIVDEPLRGVWPATAAGLDAATGEILARLDADSVPAPGWLAEVERRMTAPDRPDAISGGASFYGGTAAVRWIARNVYIGGYFLVIGWLLGHPPIFGSNYAIRADAWRAVRERTFRDRGDVHDDLDLSWWMQPGMRVVRDPALVVSVSARPFDTWSGLGRRVRIAFHTLAIEFRGWAPLERRRAHIAAQRAWRAERRAAMDAVGDGPEAAAEPGEPAGA